MSLVLVLSGVLTVWSGITLWLIGRPHTARAGFMTGIACQGLWLAFDWYVGAYGLMPLAFVYGPLYWRGYVNHQRRVNVDA